ADLRRRTAGDHLPGKAPGAAVLAGVVDIDGNRHSCPLLFKNAFDAIWFALPPDHSSILPKSKSAKSSTRWVRLGATGAALAASTGAKLRSGTWDVRGPRLRSPRGRRPSRLPRSLRSPLRRPRLSPRRLSRPERGRRS